ncbi:MAG: SDR family NAD(P)-dependent oxidoreductase [Hyellaceae cyanobacterium CSU_1_1]|nr:SDR family NAD(P)-dependent oxidoreductase [Hyellaceae cyanobacterium CSU_1_1]
MTQATTGLEVAIIGISGRFPQSKDIESFWSHLINGRELTSTFPETKTTAGGILEDVDLFDASFFGFNPREAEMMDPQHRLFLESAWTALENAGYDSERESRPIGVYAGVGISTYLLYNLSPNQELIKSRGFIPTLVGVDKDYLPTRVSYKLNLTGPSMSVGTACSSSLVAVHLACQSLLSGECDMTLAAGVAIKVPQDESTLSPGVIVSADGHCRAFAAGANGTIGGNGIGVVVLKRLEDAIADRDYIYGVIKGSAINNDGAVKVGYTAPSQEGQARVIRAAQIMAEVEPETISYIEAHGTGTTLGDPIEIAALTQAFNAGRGEPPKGLASASPFARTKYCAIGSVKTNVGHLDAAAGITGLIKTVLALDRQLLPPSLNFDAPNPEIDFDNSPFYVNNKLTEWKSNGKPRRAAVSSFGFGGTNAHVILEEAPVGAHGMRPASKTQEIKHHLLVISAKTSSALETATNNLVNYLKQHPEVNLDDVAYTLQVGRRVFNHRRIVVVENVEDAITALESPQILTQCQETKDRPVVFMFTGQGSQYVNMARELYETEEIFRQECDRCFELLKPDLELDLRSHLYPTVADTEQAAQQLQQTGITQLAIFVIEYALAKLWMSWGVKPAAMIGHSIGEYVAACLAGVFSLEDALALVTARGQLMQQLPSGSMLAVPLSSAEILPLLGENLSLAVVNGISNCVVSGTTEAIATLQDLLATQGIDCRRLHTSHAFHSPMMEPMLESFLTRVQQVNLKPPQIPYISNVTGTWITAAEATNPAYWTTHLRQTVRFEEGLQELFKQPEHILLEVGAGRTLSKLAKQHPEKQPSQIVLSSVRHPKEAQSDLKFILNTLGQLWLSGVEIDWSGFYQQEKHHRLPLPTYPFERQRYWIEPPLAIAKNEPSKLWDSLLAVGIQASKEIGEKEQKTYVDNQQLLASLSMAYMNLALRQQGAFSNPQEQYTRSELAQQCQVIARYQPLLNRWLQILTEKGQLEQKGDKFTNLVPCPNSIQALLEQVRVNQAVSPKILDLVRCCGENLAGVITGKQQPLEFFKGLLYEFKEAGNEPESPGHARYSSIIRAVLAQVSSSFPAQRNLRVLEIASGVSQATEELIPVLSSSATSYTFADVSGSFLSTAQQKFSKYPLIECRALDLDLPFSEQQYSLGSFDVIVAVKSLHTAKDLAATLDNVRSLLAPGGVLLLWEQTQAGLDFELTWALLIEPSGDSLDSPYLSAKQWQKALDDSGFVEVAALPETAALGEHILLAQASTKKQDTRQIPQVAAAKKTAKKPDLADWFYVPSWKRSILPQPIGNQNRLTRSESWLVFMDREGLGEQIWQRLELEGQNAIGLCPRSAIAIQVGDSFSYQGKSPRGQRIYTINPQSRDDYEALIAELLDLNWTPSKVLHLWSVTSQNQAPSGLAAVDRLQERGFYSLLFLVQALAKSNLTKLEIAVISNNLQSVTGEEAIAPEKATLLGGIKTIPLEYPNISCRSIDVILPAVLEEKLVEQLLTEVSTPSGDRVIAYRGKHRWIQTFEPIRLETRTENTPQLRAGGVYLITGGLGGIGLVMAENLARKVRAKLILCGRSEFPECDRWSEWLTSHEENNAISVKIRQIQALEALGAEVLVARADVSDRASMQSLVNQAQERFGKINGIIHGAGVAIPGKIASKSLETVKSVLSAKVKGVLVLEEIFQDTPLDFWALFSSLSSLSGGYALDYVAANAFLDSYAHYRSVNDKPFTVVINWDNWQQVGMAVQESVSAELKPFYAENQQNSLATAEGIDAFNRILSYSLPQVIVTGRDLEKAIAQHHAAKAIESQRLLRRKTTEPALTVGGSEVIPSEQLYPRPNLGNAYVSPRNHVEQTLVDLWQQLLGIEQVGIYDNFFELGGDSILSFQVALKAKQNGLQLQPNQLFEHPTIADLAKVADLLQPIQPKEESRENEPSNSSQSSNGYTANLSQIELDKLLTKINRR